MVKDYKDLQIGHISRIPYPVSRIPKSGITLIELIAVIVVVGLSLPALMLMLQDVAYRAGRSEAIAQADFYAQELMEEVKSKKYDERDAPPWTSSSDFGADAGEDGGNSASFDDIDDYVGCTDPDVTNPAPGYTRQVNVNYVRLVDSAWQDCGSTSCIISTDCSNCNTCCYKRIEVSVSHRFGDASLVTIMSGF